jgi:hypothetical protein
MRFGVDPSRENVILGLSVAQHETLCGDAKGWEGENNIGAVQERVPTPAERSALVGIPIHPNTVDEAREMLAAHGHRTAGLHVDSSPGKGYYWIYFRCFPTEAEGFSFFVKILAHDRPSCRRVLEAGGPAHALAQAMYESRYFEGFHKKGHHYERNTAGKWVEVPDKTSTSWTGEEINIASYGGALQKISRTIAAALDGRATRATIRRGSRGEDVKAAQRIVGATADGIFGPLTEAAVIRYQQSKQLVADGIVGPRTWAAMESP